MEISVNSNRPANRQGEKKMATTVKIRGDNRRILGDVNVGIGAQTHPRVLNKKALSRYVLILYALVNFITQPPPPPPPDARCPASLT
ncbi:hypothetical protein HanPSC8_Chr15g0672891 [Helianthus annuus]|nr:hypothetical protein HanPSC8_Chr15g0672891 [Helianthus annuus]